MSNGSALSPLAGHIVNVLEATLRAGGHPFRPDEQPPRVRLSHDQRRDLVAARERVLHALRGEGVEQELADEAAAFAAELLAMEVPRECR